jgi:hypothetical protein
MANSKEKAMQTNWASIVENREWIICSEEEAAKLAIRPNHLATLPSNPDVGILVVDKVEDPPAPGADFPVSKVGIAILVERFPEGYVVTLDNGKFVNAIAVNQLLAKVGHKAH